MMRLRRFEAGGLSVVRAGSQGAGVCRSVERKSLQRQSFLQQSVPTTKATPQAYPFSHRLSLALLLSRFCPLQSLSLAQVAEQ